MSDIAPAHVPVKGSPSGGRTWRSRKRREQRPSGWEDGHRHRKGRSLWLQAPRKCSSWIEGYAAVGFFAVFAGCLAVDLGASFFATFALSFAENSCLTFAEMASVSTL